jgi:hypothetical protein
MMSLESRICEQCAFLDRFDEFYFIGDFLEHAIRRIALQHQHVQKFSAGSGVDKQGVSELLLSPWHPELRLY